MLRLSWLEKHSFGSRFHKALPHIRSCASGNPKEMKAVHYKMRGMAWILAVNVRTGGKSLVHLNTLHGNSNRVVKGFKCLICEKEVVWWKQLTHKDVETLLDSIESGNWRLGSFCLCMPAVLHFRTDLVFVNVRGSRKSWYLLEWSYKIL